MALIMCSDCGETISDKSKICIRCGCPVLSSTSIDSKYVAETISVKRGLPSRVRYLLWIAISIIVISGVILGFYINGRNTDRAEQISNLRRESSNLLYAVKDCSDLMLAYYSGDILKESDIKEKLRNINIRISMGKYTLDEEIPQKSLERYYDDLSGLYTMFYEAASITKRHYETGMTLPDDLRKFNGYCDKFIELQNDFEINVRNIK